MEEETTTTQAVVNPPADGPEPAANDDKLASELERARKDAANYRTKLRDLEAKWKETEPVLIEFQKLQEAQKTDVQKAADRAAQLERELADTKQAAEIARRETQAVRLATRAGMDLDLLPFLDLSKIDLDDEKTALEVLGKLAAARSNGNASNPGRGGPAGETVEERRARLITPSSRSTMFGG